MFHSAAASTDDTEHADITGMNATMASGSTSVNPWMLVTLWEEVPETAGNLTFLRVIALRWDMEYPMRQKPYTYHFVDDA